MEIFRSRKKTAYWKLLVFTTVSLSANPEKPQVHLGEVSFQSEEGKLLSIQVADRAILDWESFSIQPDEITRFVHASSSGAVLNRVVGSDLSEILGRLESNGSLYLINPNGILFGKEAVVDVAACVASLLDIPNADFLRGGELVFKGESTASLIHLGTILAREGNIALLAHRVESHGELSAPSGVVSIGAGHEIVMQPGATPFLWVKVGEFAADGIAQDGAISAVRAEIQAVSHSYALGIQLGGKIDALSVEERGGEVFLRSENNRLEIAKEAAIHAPQGAISIELENSSFVSRGTLEAAALTIHSFSEKSEDQKPILHTGVWDVSGKKGGDIQVRAAKFLTAGILRANGETEGGTISLSMTGPHIEMQASLIQANGTLQGGRIDIQSGASYFSSGTVQAQGQEGGQIFVSSERVLLPAAQWDARGEARPGAIRIEAAQKMETNRFTSLRAESRSGEPGAIEWTQPSGCCSHLPALLAASDCSTCTCVPLEFADPNPTGASSSFGNAVVPLTNGNVAIAKEADDLHGANSGAVYLYNGTTAALLHTLLGGQSGDSVGSGGIFALTNGNYVVSSEQWQNGMVTAAGAATWCSGTGTGGVDTVSSSNSLVGTNMNDQVSDGGIGAFSNGNGVVLSFSIGFNTWINGTDGKDGTGSFGAVSLSNSISGNPADFLSLENGNGVLRSPSWNSHRGAVTWISGSTGHDGTGGFNPVSASNSIVGSNVNDGVGGQAFLLSDGTMHNCAIISSPWNTNRGAVTWMSGVTGKDGTGAFGAVSTSNSIVGSNPGNLVGSSGGVALGNGNFVFGSRAWNSDRGAATWMNGTTGKDATGAFAAISSSNSLIGSSVGDLVCDLGVIALGNNNCLISSPSWNSNRGAVTWMDGGDGSDANGNYGPVSDGTTPMGSTANSIFGSAGGDQVGSNGSVAAGNNGFAISPAWDGNVGAVTWINGETGQDANSGFNAVSPMNSIIGAMAGDMIGSDGATELTNGNIVIASSDWNGNLGAATWVSGLTGFDGLGGFNVVSPSNSITGSSSGDFVSGDGIFALADGNAVICSSSWQGGKGAATWMNGTTGKDATGDFNVVFSTNSLVGTMANDQVASDPPALAANSTYLIISINWPAGTSQGALTTGTGADGTYCGGFAGVTPENSVIGANANANLGSEVPVNSVAESFLFTFEDYDGEARVFSLSFAGPPSPPPSPSGGLPAIPERRAHGYLIDISEAFQRWTATSWGGYLEQDLYPPMYTPKDIEMTIPSLAIIQRPSPIKIEYEQK